MNPQRNNEMKKQIQKVCSICKGKNITSQFTGWCDSNASILDFGDDSVEGANSHYCEDCNDDVIIEESPTERIKI